jgi:hypothetical protein
MTFDIRLSDEVPKEPEEGPFWALYGSIQIGEFEETFVASLLTWSPNRYEEQWREAAKRLVDGEPKSAFVTSFVPPQPGDYFEWWKCYLCGEIVRVQNQLRFYDQLPSSFTADALYDFIPDRKVFSEEGSPISEWEVPLQSIREFLER